MLEQPDLGRKIQSERMRAGLGLRELARLAGIRHGHFDLIERGVVRPSHGVLLRILVELKIPDELMLEMLSDTDHPYRRNDPPSRKSVTLSLLGEAVVAGVLSEAGLDLERLGGGTPRRADMVLRIGNRLTFDLEVSVHKPEGKARSRKPKS